MNQLVMKAVVLYDKFPHMTVSEMNVLKNLPVVAAEEKAKEILGSWTDWASDKFSQVFDLMKTKHETQLCNSDWQSCRVLVQACLDVLSSCASPAFEGICLDFQALINQLMACELC